MTDEQYGREWAAQNNIPPPHKVCTGKYLWYSPEHNGYPHFHGALCVCLDADFYPTEDAAYAALAFAIKEIHKEIPQLKGENKLIKELEGLKEKAEYRSRLFVENGRNVSEEERAKSAGYADAYSFCIFRLKEMEYDESPVVS